MKLFMVEDAYLLGWFKFREARLIALYIDCQARKKVQVIKEKLKTAQSRQKSYTNVRRSPLEFEVDDWI